MRLLLGLTFFFLCLVGGAVFFLRQNDLPPRVAQTDNVTTPIEARPQSHSTVSSPSQVVSLTAPGKAAAPQPALPDPAWVRFQTGDYAGAVTLLREQQRTNPGDEQTRRNLSVAIFALGILRIEEQKYAEAEDLLEESSRMGNEEAKQVLAALKLKSGDAESAKQALEATLENSQNTDVIQTLFDLALKEGDVAQAETLLTRLESAQQPRDAGDAPVQADPLQSLRRQKLTAMKTYRSQQETIEGGQVQVAYTSETQKPMAEHVARTADSALSELTPYLGSYSTRLRIWLVPPRPFQELTGAPGWAGALFDGIIKIPLPSRSPTAFDYNRMKRDVRHETLHAYLYSMCGDVFPAWLNEGFAQIFEGRKLQTSVQALRISVGRPENWGTSVSLDGNFIKSTGSQAQLLYAKSHLLVASLMDSPDTWRSFFTDVCDRKMPVTEALRTRFEEASGDTLWKRYEPVILQRARNVR